MTALDWWLVLATAVATATTLTFVIRYAVMMRWEGTGAGRSIMALSAALVVAEVAAIMRRIDELSPSIHLGHWTNAASALGWTVIAAVYVWRNWALNHPLRRDRDDQR